MPTDGEQIAAAILAAALVYRNDTSDLEPEDAAEAIAIVYSDVLKHIVAKNPGRDEEDPLLAVTAPA